MNRELGGNSRDGRPWTEVSDEMGMVMGHGTANGKLEEREGVDAGGRGGWSGKWGRSWPGQGVAAAAVGLLPRLSLSSHLRGRALLSFFK